MINLTGPEGHYSLYTLEEGEARCEEEGLTIASPDDLLDAREMGFEYCSCSWLSDGSNGFVLREADTDCISSFSEEIIICNWSYADVWCKIRAASYACIIGVALKV